MALTEPVPETKATSDSAPEPSLRRALATRWGHEEILDLGFVGVPQRFLELYSVLKPSLTSGEAMFVIHLMSYKWGEDAPFPGYGALAKRMGVSDKAVRRHAVALENKRYLRRLQRVGSTNRFDLTPLFDALAKAVAASQPGGRRA